MYFGGMAVLNLEAELTLPSCSTSGLEIPNGLPIIYDLKSKCVKLLDDGTGRDPLEVHNFGTAADYLFRPCEGEEDECHILTDEAAPGLSAEDQAIIDSLRQPASV